MEILFILISLFTGSIFYLLWEALKSSRPKAQPEYVIVCAVILGAYCVLVSSIASIGFWSSVIAAICSVPVGFAAIVSTLIIVVEVPNKRKIVPFVLGMAFVATLYVSYSSGVYASPESETKRNGVEIATAIEAHLNENGTYPTTFDQLVPQYLESIPPILVEDRRGLRGTDYWYYQQFEDGYALGYLDSAGSMLQDEVCAITSINDKWECYPIGDQDNPFLP